MINNLYCDINKKQSKKEDLVCRVSVFYCELPEEGEIGK